MHSKSDCRLLWRVAADMFIVAMAVGAEVVGVREGGRGESLPDIRVSKAPGLYGGQTDGNSGRQETPSTHQTTPQIPKHTFIQYIQIHTNAPNVYKTAIFLSAFTKPGSCSFHYNHLPSMHTCSL